MEVLEKLRKLDEYRGYENSRLFITFNSDSSGSIIERTMSGGHGEFEDKLLCSFDDYEESEEWIDDELLGYYLEDRHYLDKFSLLSKSEVILFIKHLHGSLNNLDDLQNVMLSDIDNWLTTRPRAFADPEDAPVKKYSVEIFKKNII